jgi:ADP-ribosylglycohydrolase
LGHSTADFVQKMGLANGVSGYALHVVPVALFACLRHEFDFQKALSESIDCGGDTDTVAAIVGALCGCRHGVNAILDHWLHKLWEWPRSRSIMEKIASRLSNERSCVPPLGSVKYFWPAQLLRNLVFLLIILVHGIRRLFPPY